MSLNVIGLDVIRVATAPQLALVAAGRMAKLFRLVHDGGVLDR